jgi:hypothetical protein
MKIISKEPRTDAALHKYCQDFNEISIRVLAAKIGIPYYILWKWFKSKKPPRLIEPYEDALTAWAITRGFNEKNIN